jgi:hypothetical protein
MVIVSYPSKYQIRIGQNWQDHKEPLMYVSIILLFTIIGAIIYRINNQGNSALFSMLLIVLIFMFLTYILPVATLTFDVEKNWWEIRHEILKIPTRLHTGQILNISSLAAVKNIDNRKKDKKKVKITLELWGFENGAGNRDRFMAFSHDYYNNEFAEKGIMNFSQIGLDIIEFFQKFQIPIDFETASREINETEI